MFKPLLSISITGHKSSHQRHIAVRAWEMLFSTSTVLYSCVVSRRLYEESPVEVRKDERTILQFCCFRVADENIYNFISFVIGDLCGI